MDDEARKKANELFKRYMAEESGKAGPKKSAIAEARAQGLLGVDLSGGNFCDQAPKIVDMLQKEIRDFSFLIPDKIETPAKVFLRVFEEAVLPVFCGTASGSGAASATGTAASTGTATGGAQKRS